MTDAAINPAAPHHLPWFITPPGGNDGLFTAMIIFLIVVLVLIGVLYFKLHALPEHLAHRGNKIQMEIVAVLAVLALFTHEHLFWIIGLLLALIELPDFSTPINIMAQSLQRIAGGGRRAPAQEAPPEPAPAIVIEAHEVHVSASEPRPESGTQDMSRA
jgi:hypothetical protein